jgi:hypothetical protein
LLALVAFVQSIPTNNNDSTEEEEEKGSPDDTKKAFSREVHSKIDGTIHHIKSAGVNYTQRIRDGQCFVQYNNQLFPESRVIKIRRKIFRVDDCVLERVYHACGPNLILMLSVVCRLVEQHKISNEYINTKREANLLSMYHLGPTADRKKRVITESCCENLCSISELTRYCHQ